ncbi:MAG: DUF222 domain-containing protein, partial [Pseudohongiellaceae bacterium]
VSQKHVSAETSFNSSEGSSQEDSLSQRRADALIRIAEHRLRAGDDGLTPLAPSDRHQLVIHIEKDSLMRGTGHHCSIEQGPFLTHSAARRLACDTALLTALAELSFNVRIDA